MLDGMHTRSAAQIFLKSWLFVLVLFAVIANPLSASAALDPPAGRVLLVIDGNISNPNVGDELQLDREALKALTGVSFKTQTPWDADEWQEFSGVSLRALLEAAGAGSTTFTAVGVDDYAAEFGDVDLDKYAVMIAYEQSGKAISLRHLGPLRIMFPFSDHPELKNEAVAAMAVWQLVRMTVH